MLARRALPILPTLGMLLLWAPRVACLYKEGAQPVPVHVIQEALAHNARYRHELTLHNTRRRILSQARQQTYSTNLFGERLFRSVEPRADNEQKEDGNHDPTRNTISLRQVGLEGSAQPLFFCSPCREATQHDMEDCARCKGLIMSQQQKITVAVLDLFPNAKIVAATQKLINMVFVEMDIAPHDDIAEMDRALSQIQGVVKILPQEDSTLEDDKAVAYIGGGTPLEEKFCGLGGNGVTVAILDSGVDYTHQRIGGAGTKAAYKLAYGTGPGSPENKQVNPEVFPTETVIGGKDLLGESFVHTAQSVASDAVPDENPIDANRHGTMVADAILSVAPQTKLLAYKVCTSDTGTCPGFAVLQALEFALDPNGDGNIEDAVDIVNLSLGGSYLSSYYDLRTAALEKVFKLGVLPVVAAGNEGNIPYIAGPGARTPNAISVAATSRWKTGLHSIVAGYSSRGPGDENLLKPDISAPSGLSLAAFGTGNELLKGVEGTSFAAPIVAGSLALLKERCPSCSPFALKAILMNNAKRHVQYHTANQPFNSTNLPIDDAPNSLVGAGEVQLQKALDADVWAFCIEDTQPTLSFGLINAYKDTTIKKTIKVINLSGKRQNLRIRNQFSTKVLNEVQVNPLNVSFSPAEQVLQEGCNTEVQFEVALVVDASKAPPNRMTSGGKASNDPSLNDWNEFGGWVIIQNVDTNKDISLPYHAIVRQASDLRIQGNRVIENFKGGPTLVNIGLSNYGAGVAQVDAFELLFVSEDDAEGGYGEEVSPSDFRYIGYRVLQPEGKTGKCDYLLEFSFTTWEKQRRLNLEFFQVHIDVNFDNKVDFILFNSGVFTPFTDNILCVVRDKATEDVKCTGMPPDHGTNTGNTVLRVCSNDIGFAVTPTGQQKINVYFLTATATHLGATEVTDRASEKFVPVYFPQASISAPSYDIYPGETLKDLEIDGIGGDGGSKPLGLMLVTNSNRGASKTGAASAESETLILTNGPQNLPTEATTDDLLHPVAEEHRGPDCAAWKNVACAVSRVWEEGAKSTRKSAAIANVYKIYTDESTNDVAFKAVVEPGASKVMRGAIHALKQSNATNETSKCPEIEVPRSKAMRVPKSDSMLTPAQNSTAQASSQPTGTPLQNTTIAQASPPPNSDVNSTAGIQETPSAAPVATLQPTAPTIVFAPSNSPSPEQDTALFDNATRLPISSRPVSISPTTERPSSGLPALTTPAPQTGPPSLATNMTTEPPLSSLQTSAPTPLPYTSRPTGPVTAAIDMTQQYVAPVSSIFSPGVSHLSPAVATRLAAVLILALI